MSSESDAKMAEPASPTKASQPPSSPSKAKQTPQHQEDILRRKIFNFRSKIGKREPLHPSYQFLLSHNPNVRKPHYVKDKMYKEFGADLRERIESYMGKFGVENPALDGRKEKIGANRKNLDIKEMKNAFRMNECNEFEQEKFIKAELEAIKARRLRGGLIEEGTRKRTVEAMALGLQEKERKRKRRDGNVLAAIRHKLLETERDALAKKKAMLTDEKEVAEIEMKLRQKQKEAKEAKERHETEEKRRLEMEEAKLRERQRELERMKQEEEERLRAEEERNERMRRSRLMDTPNQALQRFYQPMFQELWEQEFFDGTNPFRIVITAENCEFMGAPNYGKIIKKPMVSHVCIYDWVISLL